MTLVPIIYTSLLIFLALLMIVVIISYAAYRVKSNNALKPADRIRGENLVLAGNMENIVSNVRLASPSKILVLPHITKSITRSVSQKPAEKRQSGKSMVKYPANRNSSYQEKTRFAESMHESRESVTRSRASANAMRYRLEIMNNLSLNDTSTRNERRESPQRRKTHDLSDYNLLHFYADENESDMLKTTTVALRQAL